MLFYFAFLFLNLLATPQCMYVIPVRWENWDSKSPKLCERVMANARIQVWVGLALKAAILYYASQTLSQVRVLYRCESVLPILTLWVNVPVLSLKPDTRKISLHKPYNSPPRIILSSSSATAPGRGYRPCEQAGIRSSPTSISQYNTAPVEDKDIKLQ